MGVIAEAHSEAKKVLIVDDEHNILDLVQRALNAAGFDVITADSALDGLLALQDNPVSMIITDVKMPGMNGLDLMKQVREINPDIPIAVITGFGTEEMATAAMDHGAFYFINKPFNVESIQEVARKGMRLPGPGAEPPPDLLSKAREQIDLLVAPNIESIKGACALLNQSARAMGFAPGIYSVKAPFALDELLVNEMKWRHGASPGVETKVNLVLEGGRISINVESPEKVFTDIRLPKSFFDIDYDDDSPAGMRMILQIADKINFSESGRKASVVISSPQGGG